MVVGVDEREPVKLTWKFYIKPTSSSIYLKKTKHDNNKIMQINSW